jgi:hypothetical protein
MMPREWSKEQREAQSIKIKAAWARKKQAQMTWWQRIKSALGLR